MSSTELKDFQEQVSELLLRHRSILDVMSKLNQSTSSINRSVTKAITECGCIEVSAKRQEYSEDITADQAKAMLESHLNGQLCEQCFEMVTSEFGKNLFYMSALSNLLGINMDEVVSKESKKCSTLGFFNLS